MSAEVLLPRLSDSMEEGTILYGVDGARFLARVRVLLEEPVRLAL